MTDYQNEVLEFERIMKEHTNYMRNSINLIASENITSSDVTEAVASDLAHRYAEGQSHERLYEGCQYIDEIEDRVIDLSKKLFNVDPPVWDKESQQRRNRKSGGQGRGFHSQ